MDSTQQETNPVNEAAKEINDVLNKYGVMLDPYVAVRLIMNPNVAMSEPSSSVDGVTAPTEDTVPVTPEPTNAGN